jgi:GNAT superfamily N-acetyltransferase
MRISTVTEADLAELLALMRGYCDFYEVSPADDELLALSRALIADPVHDGTQLIARDDGGRAIGFATLYWSWSTLDACRMGIMYDLFVDPGARGGGVGRALIEACADRCREREIRILSWETAPDNATAQALYDSIGAEPGTWIVYELGVERRE